MDSCKESIYNLYTSLETPKWNLSWFPIIFTIFANILCFVGIIGNILCSKIIKQEKNKFSLLKNDSCNSKYDMNFRKTPTKITKSIRNNKASIEEITFIIYRAIAFANIFLLGIYYLFQIISFSEHIYFTKLSQILIENELDQYGRWTNEILAYFQDSVQSYILMLFLIVILNQYCAVFEPCGRKLICANGKVIKIYIVIVGLIIIICQAPNIFIPILEMKFYNASHLSLIPLYTSNTTKILYYENLEDFDQKKNGKFLSNGSINSSIYCEWILNNNEEWALILIILASIYELCCNTIPFLMYDRNSFSYQRIFCYQRNCCCHVFIAIKF